MDRRQNRIEEDRDAAHEPGPLLPIPRYVRPVLAKADGGGEGALATAWGAFDASGREFWQQIDEVIDALDAAVAEEAVDVQ